MRPYCGCAGVVAGGGVAVSVVGVEPGSKYQTRITARTTAAAMMSNLFVSIGSITVLFAVTRYRHVAPWNKSKVLQARHEPQVAGR